LGGAEIQLHKQTWLTRLHAQPTSNMFTYLQYLLNAQLVYLFSGFSYIHAPNGSQPGRLEFSILAKSWILLSSIGMPLTVDPVLYFDHLHGLLDTTQ